MNTNKIDAYFKLNQNFDALLANFNGLSDFAGKLGDLVGTTRKLIHELDKHDIPASAIHLVLDIKKKLKVVDAAVEKGKK